MIPPAVRRGRQLALGLALASAAVATTVVQVSEEQLIDRADLVVHGSVVATSVVHRPGTRIGLFTEVSLDVQEVLKGRHPGGGLTVSVPGGARGSQVVQIPGAPRFYPGEQVVVFLVAMPGGARYACAVATSNNYCALTAAREEACNRAIGETSESVPEGGH